ncbi:hypothetical protein WA026_012821, partial [Henosepilachna vigintioctopunctata]
VEWKTGKAELLHLCNIYVYHYYTMNIITIIINEVTHESRCITVFSAPNYCDTIEDLGAYINLNGTDSFPGFRTYDAVPQPKVRAFGDGSLIRCGLMLIPSTVYENMYREGKVTEIMLLVLVRFSSFLGYSHQITRKKNF